MPETGNFDRVNVSDGSGDSTVILPRGLHRNGVDVIGGEVPTIAKLPDDASQVDANRKINELIDLTLRGGLSKE